MFEVDAPRHTWSRTIHGRGKRAEIVTTGCYMVEHISTGKFLIGTSEKVSQEVDKIIDQVTQQTHSNKKFVKLCANDNDLKLIEFPTKTLKAAKALEKAIRNSTIPPYLLMN